MADKTKKATTVERARQALAQHDANVPTPPRLSSTGILGNTTPQAIPKFINESGIQSLGIMTPEGEEFLTNGIKHSSSMLNKMYSHEAIQNQRVGEGNQDHDIPATVLIFVQPDVADQTLGNSTFSKSKMRGSGTLARAIFAYPPSTQGHRFIVEPNADNFSPIVPQENYLDVPATKKRYRRWVSDQLNRSDRAAEKTKSRLKLSREAQALWYQGFNECEMQIQPNGRYTDFKDHASKLPDQWLRVAGIIHCYNHRCESEISALTLQSAMHIVNACSNDFQKAFAKISKEDKHLFSLRKYLEDKRQQHRYLPKKVITANGPVRPVSALDVALHTLYQRGEILISQYPRYNRNGQATRPITMIDLYPHWMFNQQELQQAINATYQLDQL